MEIRAVCSSDTARRRVGRKTGHRPVGRPVAELRGDPRPEKETEVIAAQFIAGFRLPGVKPRLSISSSGFHPSSFILIRSISLLDALKDTPRFAGAPAF